MKNKIVCLESSQDKTLMNCRFNTCRSLYTDWHLQISVKCTGLVKSSLVSSSSSQFERHANEETWLFQIWQDIFTENEIILRTVIEHVFVSSYCPELNFSSIQYAVCFLEQWPYKASCQLTHSTEKGETCREYIYFLLKLENCKDFHNWKPFVLKSITTCCIFTSLEATTPEQCERCSVLKGTMQCPVVMSTRLGRTQLIRGRC